MTDLVTGTVTENEGLEWTVTDWEKTESVFIHI